MTGSDISNHGRLPASVSEAVEHSGWRRRAVVLDRWWLGLASDLSNLLAKSSITEQRSFLKSFVEKIEADDEKVKMYYTIPMSPHSVSEETVGVLLFVHHG